MHKTSFLILLLSAHFGAQAMEKYSWEDIIIDMMPFRATGEEKLLAAAFKFDPNTIAQNVSQENIKKPIKFWFVDGPGTTRGDGGLVLL